MIRIVDRFRLVSLALCLAPLISTASAQRAESYLHDGPILIRNITVIDGLGHSPYPMRDILMSNGRIEKTSVSGQIGDIPDDTFVIDGEGLAALPGLIDLHVHIGTVSFRPGEFDSWDTDGITRTLNAHLYAGVTTVQDLGNDHDRIVGLRDAINSGERIGPTIYATGDNIGRLLTVTSVLSLTSEETQAEIKTLLDVREAAGIDTIKLYAGVSNWSARHIMTAAKQRNMQGIADFWCTNLSRTTFEVALIDSYAHGGCREITEEEATWMRENDKFAMMTLMAFDTMGGHRQYEDIKTRGFLKDPLVVDPLGKDAVNSFYAAFTQLRETFEDGEDSLYATQLFGDIKHLLSINKKNVKTLHEAGVLVGMGTDSAFPPGTWPGEAMHHELDLHVQAGISPIAAISMATYNGARILRREQDIGSIEKGKIADMLIVRGDPATNISDTRNIVHVIKGGKLVDRSALKQR